METVMAFVVSIVLGALLLTWGAIGMYNTIKPQAPM